MFHVREMNVKGRGVWSERDLTLTSRMSFIIPHQAHQSSGNASRILDLTATLSVCAYRPCADGYSDPLVPSP